MDYYAPTATTMPLWGWSVIGVAVAAVVLPVVFFVLYCIFRKVASSSSMSTSSPSRHDDCGAGDVGRHRSPRRRTTVCHLCRRNVSEENWSSGHHRRICAVQHRGLLSTLRTPDAKLRCRHCSRRLRIWPDTSHDTHNATFVCSGRECPRRGVPIRSGPGNRFACFRCNFNLCDVCAEVMLHNDLISAGGHVDRPPSYCLLVPKEELKKSSDLRKDSLPTYEEAIEIEEKSPLNPDPDV